MLALALAAVAAADFFQPIVQRPLSGGLAVAVPPAWTPVQYRAPADPRAYAQPRVQDAARSEPSFLAGLVVFAAAAAAGFAGASGARGVAAAAVMPSEA